jgi:hypothetical protein
MRGLLACLLVLPALGCEISPVVSAPSDLPGVRYSDCDRAAEDYCEHAIKAPASDMQSCVAENRFKCVSSGARSVAIPRA